GGRRVERLIVLLRVDPSEKLLERRLRREHDGCFAAHHLAETTLRRELFLACRAFAQVRLDAREISRGDALVRYPRQQIPAAAVCVVLFVRDADHSLAPARRWSVRRSFSRAWNIRVFTVFTGHFMISATSSHE